MSFLIDLWWCFMNIIEQYIFGKKGNPAECEDGLVITDNLIAVVDGVTAKTTKKFEDLSSGAFARKVLCDFLMTSGIEKLNSEELFSKLSMTLREKSEKCYNDIEYVEYPRAAVIVYNRLFNEIWSYGDCQCMINGTLYNHEKDIDRLTSELRAFYLEYALLNGYKMEDISGDDVGRKRISEDLKNQLVFENKNVPFGYPVINGFSVNPDMIVSYKVEENDEIVLSSDGYPFLKNTLAESEEKLSYVLENDPMCFRIYKTTKGVVDGNFSFDDRCYCRFIV